jgi:hypothetical protein
MARRARRRGVRRWGIKALFEVLRWNRLMQTSADDWKLNNNFTAYYARSIMAAVPELQGFFEIRGTRAERSDDGDRC